MHEDIDFYHDEAQLYVIRPVFRPYSRKTREVYATKLDSPCEVKLSDGRGTSRGDVGDYIVFYNGTDNMAIVKGEIFEKSYEPDYKEQPTFNRPKM